jgi:hypothetical protein
MPTLVQEIPKKCNPYTLVLLDKDHPTPPLNQTSSFNGAPKGIIRILWWYALTGSEALIWFIHGCCLTRLSSN